MNNAPLSNVERSRNTRRLLLDAGRQIFTEKGYAHATTEKILRRMESMRSARTVRPSASTAEMDICRRTSSVLHYHFRNKENFFAAVFADVLADLIAHLTRVMEEADGDLWQRLVVTGCRAFVDSLSDPTVRRIVHVDGPAVLSRSARHGQASGPELLRGVFGQLRAAGLIKPMPLEPLVALFWALFFEAGTYIAEAKDWEQAREEMMAVLIRFFEGLRPEEP